MKGDSSIVKGLAQGQRKGKGVITNSLVLPNHVLYILKIE